MGPLNELRLPVKSLDPDNGKAQPAKKVKSAWLQSTSPGLEANNFFYLGTYQRTSRVLHEIVHQPFLADSTERVREI
jgi:hypothetical protein